MKNQVFSGLCRVLVSKIILLINNVVYSSKITILEDSVQDIMSGDLVLTKYYWARLYEGLVLLVTL